MIMTEHPPQPSQPQAPDATTTTTTTPAEQIDVMRSRVDDILANLVSHANVGVGAGGSTTTTTTTTTTPAIPAGSNTTKTANTATTTAVLSPSDLKPNQIWVVDPYGDQGPYEGALDDGDEDSAANNTDKNESNKLPHGQGTMQYTDGRVSQIS